MAIFFDRLPYIPINDPKINIESKEILELIIQATQFLSALNERVKHQQDARRAAQLILINECNLSSHVENHGTTQEESFLGELIPHPPLRAAKSEEEKKTKLE